MKSRDDVTAVRLRILTHAISMHMPQETVNFPSIETICFMPGFHSSGASSVLSTSGWK